MFSANDAVSASVRARQLRAIVRLAPFTLSANLLNGVVAFAVLAPVASGLMLYAWAAALLFVVAFGLLGWWQQRSATRNTTSPRGIRKAVVHAAILAMIWAMLPLLWFPSGAPAQRLIIAMITTGMLGGGAIALAPIPLASVVYVSVLGLGSCVSLLISNEALTPYAVALVVIYSVTMVASAISAARNSIARLLSERETEHQSNVIGLLLRDFEEHAADVLWETDHDGVFTHVSTKLATLLGHEPLHLQRTELLQLVEDRLPREFPPTILDSLRTALEMRAPFRDVVVPVETSGTTHWWSLTAKPLRNEHDVHIGWRGIIADVSERQAAQERLEYLAHYDALTGLANRRQLRARLQRVLDGRSDAIHRPSSDGPSALLYLDIDHFKTFNDTLGHAVGDAVLQLVATRLRACSRMDDFIVRLSGDEFAMVVDSTAGERDVTSMAERLLQSLREPSDILGHSVVINASIGIALIPAHGKTVDEVLGNADLALYASKEAGRARYQVFMPHLGERSRRRQSIEHELSNALARGELTLVWQPQFLTGTTTIRCAETLLRWNNPRLGTVAPSEFIPIAEDAAMVDDIGRWVMFEACALAGHHLDDLMISVNVSPRQLRRDSFVIEVKEALVLGGLPATRLEIEITESLFMDDVPTALRHLHELRELGVSIALDDFGTGYSSLAYLRRFPFDTLKIDRAFVRELTHRGDAQAIVRMIIELSATLGMETVAECVEEAEQLMMLQAAGCFAVQGNLLAEPMPLAEIRALLNTHPPATAARAR